MGSDQLAPYGDSGRVYNLSVETPLVFVLSQSYNNIERESCYCITIVIYGTGGSLTITSVRLDTVRTYATNR